MGNATAPRQGYTILIPWRYRQRRGNCLFLRGQKTPPTAASTGIVARTWPCQEDNARHRITINLDCRPIIFLHQVGAQATRVTGNP
jgi:hypothetical protein